MCRATVTIKSQAGPSPSYYQARSNSPEGYCISTWSTRVGELLRPRGTAI